MMNKLFAVAAAVWMAWLPLAQATTIGFSNVPSRKVVDSTATLLTSSNSLVWAGNFTNESFSLNNNLSLQDNVTAIMTAGQWEQFSLDTATGSPNAGISSTLGISASNQISGSVTDNNTGATKADYFNTKNLYLWVFNAPTVGAATEMGIYRATTASEPWVFPTNGAVDQNKTYSTSSSGAPVINAIAGIGSTSSTQLILTTVTPIPEPSAFVFGVLGAFATLCIRQRRHKS